MGITPKERGLRTVLGVSKKRPFCWLIFQWVTNTALNARWIRHKTIHHQESSRNIYLAELDADRGPLAVWSISVEELKPKLPSVVSVMSPKDIAVGLEALWIQRWKDQFKWNSRIEPVPAGFSDGNYWRL